MVEDGSKIGWWSWLWLGFFVYFKKYTEKFDKRREREYNRIYLFFYISIMPQNSPEKSAKLAEDKEASLSFKDKESLKFERFFKEFHSKFKNWPKEVGWFAWWKAFATIKEWKIWDTHYFEFNLKIGTSKTTFTKFDDGIWTMNTTDSKDPRIKNFWQIDNSIYSLDPSKDKVKLDKQKFQIKQFNKFFAQAIVK